MRKLIPLCGDLAEEIGQLGWRQRKHLYKKIKQLAATISRIAASKSPQRKANLLPAYRRLLERVTPILDRAKVLQTQAESEVGSLKVLTLLTELKRWIELTEQVCDTAYRRVILGEKVPNSEKLFSMFETHTQFYHRDILGNTPNALQEVPFSSTS